MSSNQPPTNPTKRASQWSVHFDPQAIKQKLDPQINNMNLLSAQAAQSFDDMKNKINTLLESLGVPLHFFHSYQSFGSELNKAILKSNVKNTQMTLARHAELLKNKWISRELDCSVLVSIAQFFNLSLVPCVGTYLYNSFGGITWNDGGLILEN